MLCWALRATFATIFDQMADYKQPNVIDLIHDRLILHDRICAGSSSLAKERRVLRTPTPLSFLKGECHKWLNAYLFPKHWRRVFVASSMTM